MIHDALCEWSTPCTHCEDQKHSKDGLNRSVPDASYCWQCGADCVCALIERVITAAVQRVEALICTDCLEHLRAGDVWTTCLSCDGAWEALAAIKGDQP
jgi:hypothetical protein